MINALLQLGFPAGLPLANVSAEVAICYCLYALRQTYQFLRLLGMVLSYALSRACGFMRAFYDRQTIVGFSIAVGASECKQKAGKCTIYPLFVPCGQHGAEPVSSAAASQSSRFSYAFAHKQRRPFVHAGSPRRFVLTLLRSRRTSASVWNQSFLSLRIPFVYVVLASRLKELLRR